MLSVTLSPPSRTLGTTRTALPLLPSLVYVFQASVIQFILISPQLPTFHDALTCTNSSSVTLTEYSTWPSLDYNVYASIVGDCAWAEGGCPITQQNFIDLVYSAISDEADPTYPEYAP